MSRKEKLFSTKILRHVPSLFELPTAACTAIDNWFKGAMLQKIGVSWGSRWSTNQKSWSKMQARSYRDSVGLLGANSKDLSILNTEMLRWLFKHRFVTFLILVFSTLRIVDANLGRPDQSHALRMIMSYHVYRCLFGYLVASLVHPSNLAM